MIWKLHPIRWFIYKKFVILDSIFWHHFVRKQFLVPSFWFSRTRWFSSSLFVRIPFFCHLLCCFIFLYFCFFGLIACQNSSHDGLRLCYHMSFIKKHERTCTKWKHKIAVNVVTFTTCKRSFAILGQHNTKKKVGASTKPKFNSKLRPWLP